MTFSFRILITPPFTSVTVRGITFPKNINYPPRFDIEWTKGMWQTDRQTDRLCCVHVEYVDDQFGLGWFDVNRSIFDVLGPLLFSCYISPISSLASFFGVISQQYADDTRLYIALTASDLAAELSRLSSCLSTLQNWSCPKQQQVRIHPVWDSPTTTQLPHC